ncbi:MAG TPA: DinB family protein [Blastocatellia bacterium]|nr:DinB family protein [Blastocatellia bacterium]
MIYNSVAEILEAIEGTRSRIYERVEGLSDEQAKFRPSPEKWSVADLIEHLGMTEASLVVRISHVISEIEAATAQPGARFQMKPFSLDELTARARNEKFTAPERVRPRGRSVAESIGGLRRSREKLPALRPRIEALDLSEARFPHPAFGPLNIYQWLAFIGLHEGRHLSQAEMVVSSPGFPS